MDFTMTFELKPILGKENTLFGLQKVTLKQECTETTFCNDLENLSLSSIHWCHGLVLSSKKKFTSIFCKDIPSMILTSRYNPKTQWSQTITTFKEQIALSSCTPSKVRNFMEVIGT